MLWKYPVIRRLLWLPDITKWYWAATSGFAFGVAFELVRVKWRPFGINFYDVFTTKQMERKLAAFQAMVEQVVDEES